MKRNIIMLGLSSYTNTVTRQLLEPSVRKTYPGYRSTDLWDENQTQKPILMHCNIDRGFVFILWSSQQINSENYITSERSFHACCSRSSFFRGIGLFLSSWRWRSLLPHTAVTRLTRVPIPLGFTCFPIVRSSRERKHCV